MNFENYSKKEIISILECAIKRIDRTKKVLIAPVLTDQQKIEVSLKILTNRED